MTETWTRGVTTGLPIVGVVAALLILLIVLCIAVDEDTRWGIAPPLAGGLLLLLGLTAASMWPWDADYHKWHPVSGVVTETNSRLVAVSKATDQKFVLLVGGHEYGCADTRCALVDAGDRIDLMCKPEYAFAGTAGQDCEFVRRYPKA